MWYLMMVTLAVTLAFHTVSAKPPVESERCRNPEGWAEWRELLGKNPTNRGLKTLHALRIGICVKIQHGEMTEAEGVEIFEQARKTLIQPWSEALEKEGSKL